VNVKARYLMIGGFLGAGKTTAILRLATELRDRGLRVGLITNDQSTGLVDTAMLGSHGFAVEEISGGCFCCRFNSLVDASEKLSSELRPDVFIAEPVGSCTDLKATVDYPLRRLYGEDFGIAPLSVMVDPIRAARILGIETGKSFSKKVVYIYRKQLEEAEIIVVNKTDLISAEQLTTLLGALRSEFPAAQVMAVSAREGLGVSDWLDRMLDSSPKLRGSMEVDYQTYGEGEALLGWLNCTVGVAADEPFDGNSVLLAIVRGLGASLGVREIEIAHLKLTLSPDEGNDLAVGNLVRGDGRGELSHSLQEPLEAGQLILNLRAEGDPDILRAEVLAVLQSVLAAAGVRFEMEHMESFRPGKPTPTHRLAEV
jgi:Ni2+-binding GTPase involved in maturation of urease and hydrogenase